MPRPPKTKERAEALALLEEGGHSLRQIAERVGVSISAIQNWKRQEKRAVVADAKPHEGKPVPEQREETREQYLRRRLYEVEVDSHFARQREVQCRACDAMTVQRLDAAGMSSLGRHSLALRTQLDELIGDVEEEGDLDEAAAILQLGHDVLTDPRLVRWYEVYLETHDAWAATRALNIAEAG